LIELLDTAVAWAGARPFVTMETTTLTYREFNSEVITCSAQLSALGLQEGERVLIVNSCAMQTAIIAFACAKLKCVFVIVDPGTSPVTMDYIMQDCCPALVIGDIASDHRYQAINVRSLSAAGWLDTQRDSPQVQKDTVCILYTSGSTGQPKGVAIRNSGLQFVLAAIQQRLNYLDNDVIACYLPLSFDYGLYQIFLACQARAHVVLRSPAPTSALLLRAIKRDQITVLPLVPSLWEVMVYQFRMRPHGCGGLALRAITSTGQTLQTQLIDEMRGFLPQVEVFSMYGLTECKRVSILLPEEHMSKRGSVGRPLPGTQVWVCDEHGVSLMPGEVGELVVAGEHVASYWTGGKSANDNDVFRTVDRQRRLHTGDYGYIDTDGFIFLVGRQDMLIKRRAYRISLCEIESCLYACPFIKAAVVIWDAEQDMLVGFVVLDSLHDTRVEHIDEYLRYMLETHKLPDQYIVLESFPLTTNGKVNRKALTELWLTRTP